MSFYSCTARVRVYCLGMEENNNNLNGATKMKMDKETQYLANHARLMDAINALNAAAGSLPSPDDAYSWGDVETMGHLAASVEAVLAQ